MLVTKDNNLVPETATMSMDVSENGDESVMAYTEADGDNYRLTIGGTKGVIANSNASGLFANLGGVTSIDLTYFDTPSVTSMQNMFAGCSSLTSLNLSSFDTLQVTDMTVMFQNCSGLTEILVSNKWNIEKLDPHGMFNGCGVSRVTYV